MRTEEEERRVPEQDKKRKNELKQYKCTCHVHGQTHKYRKTVKVCVPYRVITWLWCDLPFIEYLVVELDYGKMSATVSVLLCSI